MKENFFGRIKSVKASLDTVRVLNTTPAVEAVTQTLNSPAVVNAVREYIDLLEKIKFDGGSPHDTPLLNNCIAAIHSALAHEGIVLQENRNYDGTDNSLHHFAQMYAEAIRTDSL